MKIVNLGDQPIRDANVWVNTTFVHKVATIPSHGAVVVGLAPAATAGFAGFNADGTINGAAFGATRTFALREYLERKFRLLHRSYRRGTLYATDFLMKPVG